MKYLITGGAGFIGSHLADRLIDEGHEVIVYDNLSTGKLENIEHLQGNPRFSIIVSSILDGPTLEKYVQECDQIYHFAAVVGVKNVMENPVDTIRTNINGTDNILELANRYHKQIFIASTSEIYGKLIEENADRSELNEEADWRLGATSNRRWSYACSKAMDEFLSFAYFDNYDLPVVIARYFNTVGPRQTGKYGMVIPKFIERALADEPIEVYGDGEQTRSFTHVKDAVGATVKLMNNPDAKGELYNIGSNEEISINELALRVKDKAGSSSEIIHIPYEEVYSEGFEDMQRRNPDLSKVKNLINYKPAFTVDDIIEQTIEYFRDKEKVTASD